MSNLPFWDELYIDEDPIGDEKLEPNCPHRDIVDRCNYVQRLKRHEKYMRNVLKDTADAILGMDTNNIIRSWNKGAEQIYGYKREEIIGKPVAILFPPDRKHEVEDMARTVREKGYIKNMETERLRKDGKRIAVNITRTPIFDELQCLIGYTAIVSDVTERNKMQRQLIRSEKMASVGTFAAGLAHEIKNPLNSMSIQLVLLERRLAKVSDELLKKNIGTIRIIREGIDRLVNLTNDFLLFSSFFQLNNTLENIHALLSASISLMEGTFHSKSIEIEREFAADLPLIEVDREKIQQVFLNLMQNSIEAMPKGGILKVKTSHQNESIEIKIIDTGCGIPDEQLSHIFEIFYSTKENGTGLGLAIVHPIIELHNGEIHIESEVGKGTKCTVILPIRQDG